MIINLLEKLQEKGQEVEAIVVETKEKLKENTNKYGLSISSLHCIYILLYFT
jgi:hypothetical protein